jgi:hypothetical protein
VAPPSGSFSELVTFPVIRCALLRNGTSSIRSATQYFMEDYCLTLYGLSLGFSQPPVFSIAATISFSVTLAGLNINSKLVVAPGLSALQLITPDSFSMLLAIVLTSFAHVIPFTLNVVALTVSAYCLLFDCAFPVVFAKISVKIVAKKVIKGFMCKIFDFLIQHC